MALRLAFQLGRIVHIGTLSNSGSKDLWEYKHFQLTAADYLI